MTKFIEINSDGSYPECFEAVRKVSDTLSKVEHAASVMNNALDFVRDGIYREVIPSVVESIEKEITGQMFAVEMVARVNPDRVEPSSALSPEALAYLTSNPRATQIHSMNQVILNEDHSIRDDALNEDEINATKDAVDKIGDLVSEAQRIYSAIINFNIPVDDEDWDDEDWDEDEDWDDEDWDEDEEGDDEEGDDEEGDDDEDEDDEWWHEPLSFDDPHTEDETEPEAPVPPFLW